MRYERNEGGDVKAARLVSARTAKIDSPGGEFF